MKKSKTAECWKTTDVSTKVFPVQNYEEEGTTELYGGGTGGRRKKSKQPLMGDGEGLAKT